ncbi:thioredoxin domain-containing protein [Microbacterium sp. QXD-8]|uniref:Thioredoxin domain-containing protein n=1 Tax=Microbacterium psychrotolerans TaxID=3068321 RepID=A0ABU0Z149_9MICO|nr:thioredoxin domain-containing protein [Microbacterium sp. QXD-8]MDQ7878301.1 thioredoxin domain-containing protein [Microbacterium sp. QXD-8]
MAQAARKTNWFAIWVTAGVVVALVLVVVLVVTLNNAATPKPLPTDVNPPSASGIDSETGAILVGDGEDRLDTYIDFMCPVCNQFEQVYGAEIEGMVDDGSITLGIHPISILDRQSNGTQYSTRAANAAYCVAAADPEASLPFLQAMFENQPAEGSSGLKNSEILDIAAGVGVTGIDSCVNDGTYAGFVTAMTEQTPIQPGSQGIGTPTIVVNGEVIANSSLPEPGQLATLFG